MLLIITSRLVSECQNFDFLNRPKVKGSGANLCQRSKVFKGLKIPNQAILLDIFPTQIGMRLEEKSSLGAIFLENITETEQMK